MSCTEDCASKMASCQAVIICSTPDSTRQCADVTGVKATSYNGDQEKGETTHLPQRWQVVPAHTVSAACGPCVARCHRARQLCQQPVLLVAVAVIAKPGAEASEVLQGSTGQQQCT
jgi:hypothetical protein